MYDGFCMILVSKEGKSKTYCARAASSAKRKREEEKMKKTTNIYPANCYEARIELATAIARVKTAAKELDKEGLTDDEKFEIVWKLAFVELENLEEYRCIR